MPNEEYFPKVLHTELDQIDARRRKLGQGTAEKRINDVRERTQERRLVGLAFSGGGIRSATFNLGVLQGLANLGLLRFIDYLSMVSGGGYIGSWLTAWIKNEDTGLKGFQEVEQRLKTNQQSVNQPVGQQATTGAEPWQEPEPIQHLRRYSNYLAPRRGFLSGDTWVLFATYLRNFLLCQAVLLPAVMAVLLVARLMMLIYYPLTSPWDVPDLHYIVAVTCALILLWGAALLILLNAARHVHGPTTAMEEQRSNGRSLERQQPAAAPTRSVRLVGPQGVALALVFLGSLLFPWFAPYTLIPREASLSEVDFAQLVNYGPPAVTPSPAVRALWEVGLFGGLVAVLVFICMIIVYWRTYATDKRLFFMTAFGCAAGFCAGALLYVAYLVLHGMYGWDGFLARDYIRASATARLVVFGPALVLGVITLGVFLAIGLLKSLLSDELREWWSSFCARLLIAALLWLGVTFIALYGTTVVLLAAPWVRAALASGWLLTVGAGVLAGRGAGTQPQPPVRFSVPELLARFAPHLFLVGLLIGISLLLHVVLDKPPRWDKALDTVWQRHLEPEHPSTKVTEVTVRKPHESNEAQVERKDMVERNEKIDVDDIARQMYWLGILNTDSDFVPKETYRLSKYDINRLREEGVSPGVLQSLKDIVNGTRAKGWERSTFMETLDKALPAETPYLHRMWIIRYAKDVSSIAFDRDRLMSKVGLALIGCLVMGSFMAWRVDVNMFSLHGLYRNRLTRSYLGASRHRSPDSVTELDADDDLPLADLRNLNGEGYDGPYPIINTAMNLVQGDRLDWQERQALSFVLTPHYCGFGAGTARNDAKGDYTCYRATGDGYGGNVSLGTAITLSGAAASPNMGYHSSPFVTALLTVFNARLGAWIGNPASATRWNRSGPRMGFLHLFYELFGLTRRRGPYVYLSDGGHFENLGAYELIRRRCQYVIVSDAGADVEHGFFDLGNLIRKVRVDFGLRVEITLDQVALDQPRRSRWHCAVGRIRYDDVDPNAVPGTLIYLKPSLTGDEPADVLHYAKDHLNFPHETTGDQFFSESQFESYRALGQHVAEAVFALPAADLSDAVKAWEFAHRSAPGEMHRWQCRELFSALVRRWFAIPPEYETEFVKSTEGYVSIQKELQDNALLWRLAADVYPEFNRTADITTRLNKEGSAAEQATRRRVEVHFVARMLQVMENAWLSLNLDVTYPHPLIRGWMDVFHRWTNAPAFREYWPILRSEFGRDFVSFCEKQMRMGLVRGIVHPLPADSPLPEILEREFRYQWPLLSLHARRNDASDTWLVYPSGPHSSSRNGPDEHGVCGVIMVTKPVLSKGAYSSEEPVHELFIWIRGAYRNSGLGRPALSRVLEQLSARLQRPFRLRIRLPVADMAGSGGKLQRAMWLTFFHHLDFVRLRPAQLGRAGADIKDDEDSEIVLDRHFGPVPH